MNLSRTRVRKEIRRFEDVKKYHPTKYLDGYTDALKWVHRELASTPHSEVVEYYESKLMDCKNMKLNPRKWSDIFVKLNLNTGVSPLEYASSVLQAARSWVRIGNSEEVNSRLKIVDSIVKCYE